MSVCEPEYWKERERVCALEKSGERRKQKNSSGWNWEECESGKQMGIYSTLYGIQSTYESKENKIRNKYDEWKREKKIMPFLIVDLYKVSDFFLKKK